MINTNNPFTPTLYNQEIYSTCFGLQKKSQLCTDIDTILSVLSSLMGLRGVMRKKKNLSKVVFMFMSLKLLMQW